MRKKKNKQIITQKVSIQNNIDSVKVPQNKKKNNANKKLNLELLPLNTDI